MLKHRKVFVRGDNDCRGRGHHHNASAQSTGRWETSVQLVPLDYESDVWGVNSPVTDGFDTMVRQLQRESQNAGGEYFLISCYYQNVPFYGRKERIKLHTKYMQKLYIYT